MPIRFAILLILLLAAAQTASAQDVLWSRVTTVYDPPKTSRVQPTHAEAVAIRKLLRSPAEREVWACIDDPEEPDWVKDVIFSNIALAPGHKTILVEAGVGCARGGQGSNGAMWIVEFHGSKPTLIASPKQNFGGWLYSVQPNPDGVYSDIILGWHMSAFETGLAYFRFNGRSYNSIGGAVLKYDEDGGDSKGTLIPNRPTPPAR